MIEIPNYTIGDELGQGGMATVYLAVQDMLSRQVGLKVMLPDMARDVNFRNSFISEGKIIANLEHSNIVRIHDVGVIDNSILYMAMEYLSGGTLKEKLKDRCLSYAESLRVLEQVSSGLDYAHGKGYIHRDVKPGNILFRDNGTAVLTDFGIAKLQDTSGELTRMGYTMGTVQYMSPEQAITTDLDQRSDIYSLGLVFYEMLTGQKAFKAESTIQAIHQHTTVAPPRLPIKYGFLQETIDKVLAKDPNERYQTVGDFVEAVRKAADTDKTVIYKAPAQTVATQSKGKKRHTGLLAGTIGILLVGFLLIVGAKYSDLIPWLNKVEKTNVTKNSTQTGVFKKGKNKQIEIEKQYSIVEKKEQEKEQQLSALKKKEDEERIAKDEEKQDRLAEEEKREQQLSELKKKEDEERIAKEKEKQDQLVEKKKREKEQLLSELKKKKVDEIKRKKAVEKKQALARAKAEKYRKIKAEEKRRKVAAKKQILARKKAKENRRRKAAIKKQTLARKKAENIKRKKANALYRKQQLAKARSYIRVSAILNGRPLKSSFILIKNGKRIKTISGRSNANFNVSPGRYIVKTQYAGKINKAVINIGANETSMRRFAFISRVAKRPAPKKRPPPANKNRKPKNIFEDHSKSDPLDFDPLSN